VNVVASILLAYLLGSVPFAAVAARIKGVDLRRQGSGNLGATNAIRVLGPAIGIPVLLADILKGLLGATLIPSSLAVTDPGWVLASGVAAILGHVWPIFLAFRGGKGVATAAGVFLGLAPAATGVALALFVGVLLAGRYVSLASMVAAVGLPVALALTDAPRLVLVAGIAVALLVLVKHRSNLGRILAGSENRVSLRRSKGGSP
jgi:glycerol-3-phosphate acyltransferase PlsY